MADVLIVLGTPNNDAATDAMSALLTGAGHTVGTQDDNADAPNNGEYDVVVIPDQGSLADTAGYRDLTDGIVLHNRGQAEAINLFSGSSANVGTDVERVSSTHPIITESGLSAGEVAVYSESGERQKCTDAELSAGATVLAHETGSLEHNTLVAWEQGADLTTGTAAGRRVFWGCVEADIWNTQGDDIFLASVDWAIGASTGTTPTAAGGINRGLINGGLINNGLIR